MGTSMRLHVEKRLDDKWVYVHAPGKPRQVADRTTPPIDWYCSAHLQSYETMALLANVRNYDGIPPIAQQWRGMPADASAEVLAAFDWAIEAGAHWVTLAEIKAYDYTQQITKPTKWISAEQLAESGSKIEPYLDITRRCGLVNCEVPVGYTLQPYPVRQFVSDFLDTFLPTVEAECHNTSPENIRLVMWFDS